MWIDRTILKNAPNHPALLIKGEVDDGGFGILRLQLDTIDLFEFIVEHPDAPGLGFDNVVVLSLLQVDYFLYRALAAQIKTFSQPILVWDFWIGRWDDFILFEGFVFVFWLLYHSDVLDDVLSELWPFKVAIPVNVNGLEKFY